MYVMDIAKPARKTGPHEWKLAINQPFIICVAVKLDLDLEPDPHSEKLLDSDPQKMNAEPQPWSEGTPNLKIEFTWKMCI